MPKKVISWNTSHTVYSMDTQNPGSDVAGETATAMAVASIIFWTSNFSYSQSLFKLQLREIKIWATNKHLMTAISMSKKDETKIHEHLSFMNHFLINDQNLLKKLIGIPYCELLELSLHWFIVYTLCRKKGLVFTFVEGLILGPKWVYCIPALKPWTF